jgi:hypothetical protein
MLHCTGNFLTLKLWVLIHYILTIKVWLITIISYNSDTSIILYKVCYVLCHKLELTARSWCSSLGIMTRLLVEWQQFHSQQGQRFFSLSAHLDQFWGTPCLLSNGYLGFFSQGWSSQIMKLTTYLYLIRNLRMCRRITPVPIYLHGMVLNLAQ